MTSKEFGKILQDKLTSEYGVELNVASNQQIYRSLALICRQMMSENHKKFQSKAIGTGTKQVYYLCMEFLMGRSLKMSLFNLGLDEVAKKALADADINLDSIFEEEPDAGLGNGGLGRLAACYLDGMATTGICGTGYSILYEYGIFKQKIVDGWQQERADNWLPGGQVWLKSHPDQAVEIRFDGEIHENWDNGFHYIQHTNYNSVMAIPSDMYVQGYDGKGVAKLRLWQAKAPDFDMSSFSLGNYNTAMSKNANAELISKVLYPNDNHVEGKILRLRQQYFLSAASIGDIVQNHLSSYATLENLPDKVAIQLNDTHPTLAIPEMMRILLDECGFDWDKAFSICQKVFSYTNHTVMAEALEKWNVDIFKMTLPRIYQIVVEMDRRAREELAKAFPGDQGKIDYMALIGDNQVRMANICAYTANSINGVSKLHSEIIKESVFHDYYLFKPNAFKNVTNGIAYRRWLLASNPGLCKLLDETIGDGYKHDASDLSKLNKFENDKTVLKHLNEIKLILERILSAACSGCAHNVSARENFVRKSSQTCPQLHLVAVHVDEQRALGGGEYGVAAVCLVLVEYCNPRRVNARITHCSLLLITDLHLKDQRLCFRGMPFLPPQCSRTALCCIRSGTYHAGTPMRSPRQGVPRTSRKARTGSCTAASWI